jgi:hypothetical protein
MPYGYTIAQTRKIEQVKVKAADADLDFQII